MSLLSRFRRTVVPTSSSRKKVNTDDGRLYNYQKPTKSFNEKSVKSRNFTSYTDSHGGDGSTTTGYQYHHRHHPHHHQQQQQYQQQQQQLQQSNPIGKLNAKEKVAVTRHGSGNMSRSSSTYRTNKTSKTKLDKAISENSTLSRSNTFTLEEEMNAQNKTHPHNAAAECDWRKSK